MISKRKPLLASTRRGFQTKHRSSVPVVSPSVSNLGSSSRRAGSTQRDWLDEPNQSEVRMADPVHTPLLSGLDTLTITAGGAVSPSNWLIEQQYIWSEYQKSYQYGDEYSTIEMDNKWWVLYPDGSLPYKFRIRNDEIGFIQLWNCEKWASGVSGKQQIHITLYSKFLHSTNNVVGELRKILKYFFTNVDDVSVQISRADLHLDITNGSQFLTQEQVDNVITRCKVREQYYEDNELVLDENELEMLSSPPY